jgi:glutathione peroxidase
VLTQAEPAGDVEWNFEKFLVAKDGTVLARFKSAVDPTSAELTAAIEAALTA